MKFIELHNADDDGEPVIINIDHIEFMTTDKDGMTQINLRCGGVVMVEEPYEEIREELWRSED